MISQLKEKNFWTWRQDMYNLALSLNEESLYEVAKAAFLDMLASGITSLGEFHYLHHEYPLSDDKSKPYNFDKVILKAAQDAHIRIVLLLTYYEQSGVFPQNNELEPAQLRFQTKNYDDFWSNFDELQQEINKNQSGMQSLGVCAHSIRGVKLENIRKLIQEAEKRGVPFHIHIEEQPQEIKDSLEVYGKVPSQLLLDEVKNSAENITLVHCTHTKIEHLNQWNAKKANICVCPLTEGNLGDGIFPFPEDADENLRISLGTDCNYRLCFFEEMRWLLYSQQMKNIKRGLSKKLSNPQEIFPLLITYATLNGAHALGLKHCGILKEGFYADFFTVDLSDPHFLNYNPDNLAENLILGSASDASISGVCVNGLFKELRPNLLQNVSPNLQSKESTNNELDRTSLESFLISMIQIPSTTGSEFLYSESLSQYLEKTGWKVNKQFLSNSQTRFNIYAHRPELMKTPIILFNSHLDTVPPHIPPSFEGAIIKGRGSCDAKSQIACQIVAIEELLSKYPEISQSVGLLYVVGEEVDHIGMIEANKLGLDPKFIFCGEPTELKMAHRQKGILKIRLLSQGKPAHSGYPEKGIDSLEPLLNVIQDLKAEKWLESETLGKTTMNIGVVRAGEAANVIPGNSEALILFRVVSDPDDLLKKVENLVKGRVKIETITKNGPLELSFIEGFEKGIVSFNTDIPYFKGFQEGRCQPFLYGAGSITDAHAPGEFVKKEDLRECVEGYKKMMKEILNLK